MVGWDVHDEDEVWSLFNWKVGQSCKALVCRWSAIFFYQAEYGGVRYDHIIPSLVGTHLRQGVGKLAWGFLSLKVHRSKGSWDMSFPPLHC